MIIPGAVQRRVLARAERSRYRYVIPAGYLERRALRRLAARGIAAPVVGMLDTWEVTR